MRQKTGDGPAREDETVVTEPPQELERWARKFGCSETTLLEAVNTVGRSADRIVKYLRSR